MTQIQKSEKDKIKIAIGIKTANCQTCTYLGTDGDGNYPEMGVTWPTCLKYQNYENLRSFPFKKEMKCWKPNFWHSKFATMLYLGSYKEMKCLVYEFNKIINQCKFDEVAYGN